MEFLVPSSNYRQVNPEITFRNWISSSPSRSLWSSIVRYICCNHSRSWCWFSSSKFAHLYHSACYSLLPLPILLKSHETPRTGERTRWIVSYLLTTLNSNFPSEPSLSVRRNIKQPFSSTLTCSAVFFNINRSWYKYYQYPRSFSVETSRMILLPRSPFQATVARLQ